MNRSNIGNITTNAMQTLNIAGTTGAALLSRMKRNLADASTTLNATSGIDNYYTSPEDWKKPKSENEGNQDKEPNIYTDVEYTVMDEENLIPEMSSPQGREITRYISNNLDWQKRRNEGVQK